MNKAENKVEKASENDINIDLKVAVAILSTFCAFVVCLMIMIGCLIANAVQDRERRAEIDDPAGSKRPSTEVTTDKPVNEGILPGKKTGMELPSITAAGAYLGVTNENTKDVSDDTDIQSGAIVLINATDGVVVAGKNADVKVYPASMTKVMTLLVACENAKDPNALLTLTKQMTDKYKSAGNQGASLAFEWQEGYQITVEDALHMIIYGSDTYACWLIAEHVAGGEEQFAQMMNDKAKALGLTSTNFVNCTGLYNDEHYTTCGEMAAIMAAAMSNKVANAVLKSNQRYVVDIYTDGKKTSEAGMWSAWYTGRLEEYKYQNTAPYYAGKGSDIMIIGGKTGYETIPTSCFVTAGLDDVTGKMYVCVQVGRIDKTQNTVNSSTSTYDTREMYWKYAK